MSGRRLPGTFADTAANDQERAALIARAFLDKGYNTNYAASWYLVRSVPKFTFDDCPHRPGSWRSAIPAHRA